MLMNLDNSRELRLLHLNANGLSNYSLLKQLECLLECKNVDIASINETFFNENHKTYFKNYVIYRNDRTSSRGGGVALLIRRSINLLKFALTIAKLR